MGSMIEVQGVEVPLSALSELVLRLHRGNEYALAMRLGRVLDSGANRISLTTRDEAELLDAVERHPVLGLEALRGRLLENARARAYTV
jgi:hypothetical protein